MDVNERLDRLEARHVHMMAEFEVTMRENERAWERNQKLWAEHFEWMRQHELQRERDWERQRQTGADLDKRIADLVSGFGEFIRNSKQS